MDQLVLSLFPGLDLLGLAFETEGFCVVSARDAMFGGDHRRLRIPRGRFNGIIGGPPCQRFSVATRRGSKTDDLIPEFVRIVEESGADWVVMENVLGAMGHPAVPREWHSCVLCDHDCGGATKRRRYFATWPFQIPLTLRRDGKAELSVLASTWKMRSASRSFLPGNKKLLEYGRLQGVTELTETLRQHPARFSRSSIIHMLGNGVPMAMGRTVARAARNWITREE